MARSSLLSAPAVAVATAAIAIACLATCSSAAAGGGNFYENFVVAWGDDPDPGRRVEVLDGGRVVTLTLNNVSGGSGFQSKDAFLFGEFTMPMKLVPGDSAGTVTTFYLTSKDPTAEGDGHDEIDFEFLGNVSGEPYVMQTNVFARGVGNREQRFYLWFDPTADFHNYTILWNPLNIIFSMDGVAVRVFRNHERHGVPYLSGQAMKVHATIWNDDTWVTMGGRVKTDWSHAPFVAAYGAYSATACISSPAAETSDEGGGSDCDGAAEEETSSWMARRLGPDGERAVAWAREKYMVMDYCDDPWHLGRPAECDIDRRV